MTQVELIAGLKTFRMPVAHNDFKETPALPYIILREAGARGWGSDERNEIRQANWLVEIYTVKKDLQAQGKVEAWLNDQGIEWTMTFDDLIESEGLYLTAYFFETTNKIRRA